MQKRVICTLLATASCLATAFINVHAADLLKARVNVQQEKRNAIVHFSKAAIGQFAAPEESDLNAFIGVTNDFGSAIPVYVLFKHTMSLDDGTKYAEHQGKNQGSAQCDLVQKGSSPDMPAVPVAVLAQNCTIISVKY
jgi:hypothetical protein